MLYSKQHQQCPWMWFFTKRYNFFCIGCLAGSGPPSPNKDTPPVPKPKSETKKKWLKLTRKGLLLSSICKVGKNNQTLFLWSFQPLNEVIWKEWNTYWNAHGYNTCITSLYSNITFLCLKLVGTLQKYFYLSQNEFVKILPIFSKQSTT